MTLIGGTDLAEVRRMDENLTRHARSWNSGKSALVGRAIAIRDRMPRFHEDFRNPKVSPDIAMQQNMNPK